MFVLTSVTLSEGTDNKGEETLQYSLHRKSFAVAPSLLSWLFVYMTSLFGGI